MQESNQLNITNPMYNMEDYDAFGEDEDDEPVVTMEPVRLRAQREGGMEVLLKDNIG